MIMWHGFNILRGAGGNHHLLDVFFKSLRAFLVFTLALSVAGYGNVHTFFTELRTGLTGLFVSGSPVSSYAALDASIEQAITAFMEIMKWGVKNISIVWEVDISGLVAIICGAIMVLCLLLYALVAAVNLLLIDFSLIIVWAVGPLFIACFAFNATAKFFDGWLTSVLKYTFTAVVIAAVIGVGNGILSTYTASLVANAAFVDYVGGALGALGASGILIIMAYRAPQIAADIVGGIALSVLSPSAAAAPIAGPASKIAKGSANAAAYGAGKFSSSKTGQAVSSSPAGKAVTQAMRSMKNFGNAISGRGADSKGNKTTGNGLSNAFKLG
ncbi:MAG: type IV secretion system protein, partial [Candidatus Andersenbacteria bacterium]